MFNIVGKYTSAIMTIDDVETETVRQIHSMVSHPAATNPVAIMPDCHAGKGCVVGFTMKASNKVVPNWIGVDIGCGMVSIKTNISVGDLSINKLTSIDREIRKVLPLGMTYHEDYNTKNLRVAFGNAVRTKAREVGNTYTNHLKSMSDLDIESLLKNYGVESGRFYSSIASLGGGNHFLECGVDNNNNNTVWITVHTGSRNFGKKVCEHFDNIAKNKLKKVDLSGYAKQLQEDAAKGLVCKQDISRLLQEKKNASKADFDVVSSSYVEGNDLTAYMEGMFLAQTYAELNRKMILENVVDVYSKILSKTVKIGDRIETVHNFISFTDNIIRKGSVSAYVGERIIIPFNMRDGILICEGKSNADWNYSAPHGAGRVFSRSQAKQKISMEDFKKSMEGIFSTSVGIDTLDESPMAYKDAAMIEEAIAPTAKILFKIKPIYNLKAGGE